MDDEHEERGRRRDQEKSSDSGEKGEDDGPPQPVGFFNKSLNKVRKEVFLLWGRTSQSPRHCSCGTQTLILGSPDSMLVYSHSAFSLLGSR